MVDSGSEYNEIVAEIAVRKDASIEDLIEFLRSAGLDVMSSIRALKDAEILSRGEAKLAILNSATWADVTDRHKSFQDHLGESLRREGLVEQD